MKRESEKEKDDHDHGVVHGVYDSESGEIIINKEVSTDAGSD